MIHRVQGQRWLTAGRAVLTGGLELLFPPRCLACRNPSTTQGERFCDDCLKAIQRERRLLACPTCAASVAPHEVRNGRCADCRNTKPKVKALARVGPYQGVLGAMLRQFKYSKREELLPVLGGWLVESLQRTSWVQRVEAVVCVPTHWRRQMRQRIYPAGELARFVARRLDLPCVSLLRRVRAGPHQVGLSYSDRLENVRGAFAMRGGVRLGNARLLIIDDVRTTGATLNECARQLRRAGASEIYGAVVVRVRAVHWQSAVLSTF